MLNVFNCYNFTDYDTWRGGPAGLQPELRQRNGDGTLVPPRTLKLSAGFTW